MPKERISAWYQLVEYPVKAAAFMNHKFMYLQLVAQTAEIEKQKEYHNLSIKSYQKIEELTKFYNSEMNNGKWEHILSMSPRNLPVFNFPIIDTIQNKKTTKNNSLNRINIQANEFVEKNDIDNYQWQEIEGLGYSNTAITLFPFTATNFNKDQPWVSYSFEAKKNR